MFTDVRVGDVAPSDAGTEGDRRRRATTTRRSVLALGMLGVGLIHTLDLPSKLDETPYLGIAYIGLIVASVVVAESLIRRPDTRPLVAAAGLCAAVLVGYVISRTTGMPEATGDIGNWLEPLGIASLFVEAATLVLAVIGVVDARR